MDSYKYYIDFGWGKGLEYVVLEEGWYDGKRGDMVRVIGEVDLGELIGYGKRKGVEVVVWRVLNVVD